MASKYADLPDIDTVNPDVYETPDVPATTRFDHDSDSDSDELDRSGSSSNLLQLASNGAGGGSRRRGGVDGGHRNAASAGDEAIDTAHLAPGQARAQFVASSDKANVDGRDADFSSSLAQRRSTSSRKSGYPSSLLPESTRYSVRKGHPPPKGLSSTVKREMRLAGAAFSTTDLDWESETPTERLRRLRFEMDELQDEMEAQQNAREAQKPHDDALETGAESAGYEVDDFPRRDDADKTRPVHRKKKKPLVDADGELSPAVLLKQLVKLRGNLGSLEITAPQLEDRQSRTQELIRQLKVTNTADGPEAVATGHLDEASGSNSTKMATQRIVSDSSVSFIDQRLGRLERFVGTEEAESDEGHPIGPPLMTSMAKIEHQLHLLTQPRHLDTIARRVKLLVNDLERVHEARRKIGDNRPLNIALSSGITVSTGPSAAMLSSAAGATGTTGASSSASGFPAANDILPPDALQKIDSLFSLLPRIDPLIPMTPQLLTRLRSLSALHSSAGTFSRDLEDAQQTLDGLQQSETVLKDLLHGLQESVQANQEAVAGNVSSLQSRIDTLTQRVQKLSDTTV